MRNTSIAFVKAIMVKFGNGMNTKWDNDAVRSGDMVRVFLRLCIVLRPSWGGRLRHSGFEGNKHAIRLNPALYPRERLIKVRYRTGSVRRRHCSRACSARPLGERAALQHACGAVNFQQ
jgi:hypothetical protein